MKKIILASLLMIVLSACGSVQTQEEDVIVESKTEVVVETPVSVPVEEEVEIVMEEQETEVSVIVEQEVDRVVEEPEVVVVTEVETEVSTESELEGDSVFTLEEIGKHNTREDCWTVIGGQVADVTSFFGIHPGGDRDLAKACGIDASVIFARQREHDPEGYEKLKEFVIGTLGE